MGLWQVDAEQEERTAGSRLPRSYRDPQTREIPKWRYLVHLPTGYGERENHWPMILYLHGRSIRGKDLSLLKRYGPPRFLDKNPDFPFVVISPQLPSGAWPTESLLEFVDEMTARYRVDQDRIYLTGVSMGGGAAWYLAAENQMRFAAMAPLCGYGTPAITEKVTNIPIWAFHGDQDREVPMGPHQRLVDAVNRAGGTAQITIIPGGTHGNIIFPTYKRDDLYHWFLSHSRAPEPVEPEVTEEDTKKQEQDSDKMIKPLPPAEVPQQNIYVVKKGDTLWRISLDHDISLGRLKQINGLTSDTIDVGQQLKVPAGHQ